METVDREPLPKLTFTCTCGVVTEIRPQYECVGGSFVWVIEPGYETDSGTSFPTEVAIKCPKCEKVTCYL